MTTGFPGFIASKYGNPIILANITIRDTNAHSYSTDPYAANPNSYITIVKLGGDRIPIIRSFALWVYNGENETLTVTPITNVVNDGSYLDIPITTPTNDTGQYSLNPNTPLWNVYNFSDYPIEYLSVQLQFQTTAPTSGSVLANLYLYYG